VAINQAEVILENRFFNDITSARKDLEDLKTKQRLGADSLVTKSAGEITIARSFAPDGLWYFNLTYQGDSSGLYLAEPGIALYDTSVDPANSIPMGANMDSNKKAAVFGYREDFKDAVAPNGKFQKAYLVWVWNYGPVTRTIYTKVKVLYPAFEITQITSS
jgi:hypothetical protein